MPSTRSCLFLTALLLTSAAIAADAPAPLPLDLAFARRDAWKQLQPAISPDGRYLAYDVRTPPQRMDNGPGETADLYLPSGFISIFAGVNLWVSSVETGEGRPGGENRPRPPPGGGPPPPRPLPAPPPTAHPPPPLRLHT